MTLNKSTREEELLELVLRLNRGLRSAEKHNEELIKELRGLSAHCHSLQGQLNTTKKNLNALTAGGISLPEEGGRYRSYCDGNGEYPIVPFEPPTIPDSLLMDWFRGVIHEPYITHYDLERSQDVRYLQPLLYFLARTLHAKTILEIGVADGSTTWPLIKAVSELDDGVVYSVDPSDASREAVQSLIQRNSMQKWWAYHNIKSDEFFTGPGKNLTFDFIFIDGDHSYAAVKSDLAHSLERLTEGGIIVMHDLQINIENESDLEQYPKDYSPLAGAYSVVRAMKDIIPGHYDVNYFPLHFGYAGLERYKEWTEGGAMLLRKRTKDEIVIR